LRHAAGAGRLTVRLRGVLLDALPHRLTATQAAARLYVAPRTLRRRLHDEGTTFQAVADDTHAHVASALLERGTPVSVVAEQLGYAEAASFSRAFRRWTGTAPSRWRPSAARD
jgi:AraC-like DNA-binding protein